MTGEQAVIQRAYDAWAYMCVYADLDITDQGGFRNLLIEIAEKAYRSGKNDPDRDIAKAGRICTETFPRLLEAKPSLRGAKGVREAFDRSVFGAYEIGIFDRSAR